MCAPPPSPRDQGKTQIRLREDRYCLPAPPAGYAKPLPSRAAPSRSLSSADEEVASEASHDSDPAFESPPLHRAALVLCADGLVRAYDTVASARTAHPAAGADEHAISEFGGQAWSQDEHHYSLLVEAAALATSCCTCAAALDESLLRTNVQKAVRRMDSAAAHASVLQYMWRSARRHVRTSTRRNC